MKYYLEDEYKDSCKCGNPKHGHNQNDRQQRQPIKERPVTLQARQPLVAVPPRYLNVYGNTANAQPTRMGYYAGQNTQFPYEEVREPIREPVMFAAPPRYPTTFPTKFPHEEVCHSVHEPVLMATPPPKHHINIQTSCCDQPEDIYHKKHVSTLKREAAVEVPPKESISKKCSLNRDKEVLGGQFPCPCLTTDTKCCGNESKWDEQFYKWWGWNWLKGRENELRMQMTREGKRYI